LVEIHGQFEQQTLLHPEHQLDIFDSYAGVVELRAALERQYYYLQGLRKRLAELTAQAEERARRQQFLHFQLQEIDQAQLRPGEEEEIKGERQVLMHTEKLLQITQGSGDLLYAGEDTVVERLGRVLTALDEASTIDPVLKPVAEDLRAALYQMEEAARTLGDYASRVEFDPARLAEIEERLAELSALKRKHGATVEDILAQRESLAKELDALQNQAESLEALDTEISLTEGQIRDHALDLSQRRVAVAATLAAAVEHELQALSMSAARFVIRFHRTPDPTGFITLDGTALQLTPVGLESVEFLFTSNPGEEPRPLAKIASGGEVSRVMLALKSILAAVERVPTLVFDEVDSGIGGGVAEVVGRKLKTLTQTCQVFCITHLPQVASRGDVHFLIEKQVVLGRTITAVRPLTQRERVDEIARMSGGLVITETTRKLAAELLRQGTRD
jgi:DNA repair protein RecN (Recombination protein N)